MTTDKAPSVGEFVLVPRNTLKAWRSLVDVSSSEVQVEITAMLAASPSPGAVPQGEPRFFIEHGVVHDRKTGTHVRGCGCVAGEGSAESLLALLQELEAFTRPAIAPQATPASDYTIVPLLVRFDSDQVIGELKIKTSALPMQPDFCFALGFYGAAGGAVASGQLPAQPYRGPWTLKSIAIVSDGDYLKYLSQTGAASANGAAGGHA